MLESAKPANSPNRYRLPAEWEAREATWLTWPHNKDTWPHHFSKAENQFAALVAEISKDERCCLVLHPKLEEARILEKLEANQFCQQNLEIFSWTTNDSWIRDYGPIFVIDPEAKRPTIQNFDYNCWGGKYPPYDDDQSIPAQVAASENCCMNDISIVLEGGAIECNGEGTLLTTEYCVLNKNRNADFSKEMAEQVFRDYLGIQKVWWLPGKPIAGDDTDGHIDQIARFTPNNKIPITTCQDKNNPDFECCNANLLALKSLIRGSKYEIIELAMPKPISFDGQQIPASYTNYYITKNRVLVPQFEDANDEKAVNQIQSCFPNHKVHPLGSRYLSDGLGSFHCLTQQQPAFLNSESAD